MTAWRALAGPATSGQVPQAGGAGRALRED